MEKAIAIKNGKEYLATAQALSDLIENLPLNFVENQKLIDCILAHSEAGRKEAYAQGVFDALTTDLPENLIHYL